MKVEIALDPSQLQSLASRVAPAPANRPAQPRGTKKGGAKPKSARPAKKTAEELDAEMSVSASGTETGLIPRPTKIPLLNQCAMHHVYDLVPDCCHAY